MFDDPAFEDAEDRFDVKREGVRKLLAQLMNGDEAHRVLGDALDAAISELLYEAEQWVLDRLVIGIRQPGSLPPANRWTATRRTAFDPIEYDRDGQRQFAELKKAHGYVDAPESSGAK